MVGHGAKFEQKVEQVIVALLSHKSVEDAARAVGISPNTLLRWMKGPEFRATYQEARRLAFSEALGRLREASHAAVNTTLKIMLDANILPGVRLRAAEIVLVQAAKAAELENLGARLTKRKRKECRKMIPGKVTPVQAMPLLGPPPTPASQDVNPVDSNKDGMP